jgi:predicted DNA-binding transcriptional regulator YafY
MSGTTSRMLHLLELLQSSGTRTLGELSERLGVDERTVRRYIDRLREMDVPVLSVRGRYGGYRMGVGYRMPPLMLSDDEALAVVLGLLHAQATEGASSAAAQTALSKVHRALPTRTAHELETLLDTATFTDEHAEPAATSSSDVLPPDAEVLLTVADALRTRRPLDLRYHAADGTPSRRSVHPYDLVARAGRWYLVAFDVDRSAERTFRVDRINTARAGSGTFTPPSASDGRTAESRLIDRFARADYAWRVVLRVRVPEQAIRVHLPESVALLEPLPGPPEQAWYRVEIHAEQLDWIPSVIVALGCPVVVECPEDLRTLVGEAAHRLTNAASMTPGTVAPRAATTGSASPSGPDPSSDQQRE